MTTSHQDAAGWGDSLGNTGRSETAAVNDSASPSPHKYLPAGVFSEDRIREPKYRDSKAGAAMRTIQFRSLSYNLPALIRISGHALWLFIALEGILTSDRGYWPGPSNPFLRSEQHTRNIRNQPLSLGDADGMAEKEGEPTSRSESTPCSSEPGPKSLSSLNRYELQQITSRGRRCVLLGLAPRKKSAYSPFSLISAVLRPGRA